MSVAELGVSCQAGCDIVFYWWKYTCQLGEQHEAEFKRIGGSYQSGLVGQASQSSMSVPSTRAPHTFFSFSEGWGGGKS